jgi:hypothetical protein
MTNHATIVGFTLSNGCTAAEGEGTFFDSRYAGIVAVDGCTVRTCKIVGNKAGTYGGGGAVRDSTVISCYFAANSARTGAGGLGVVGSVVELTTAMFNRSELWGGGGIQVSGPGSLGISRIVSCSIVSNCGRAVAGLNCWGHTFISNCFVAYNTTMTATSGTGGIGMDRSNVMVVSSQVVHNKGGSCGGLRLEDDCDVLDSLVLENSANTAGGLWLPFNKRNMYVNNCSVTSNQCTGSGGGILNQGTALIISNVISGNVAAQYGGGIDTWYAGTISNCLITGNKATGGTSYGGQGGGVSVHSGGQIIHCIVSGNETQPAYDGNQAARGGGVYVVGDGHVDNCLVVGNGAYSRSSYGGGISSPDDSAVIQSCTIVDNYARDEGGGAAGGKIRNTIVCNNTCLISSQPNYNGGSFVYSCTYPMPSGAGNISNAPLMGTDYHLLPGSPCINVGTNAYVTWDTDLAGAPRIINVIVDMGAYEAIPEGGSFVFVLAALVCGWRRHR